MLNKKLMILLIFFVSLLVVSVVSAADNATGDVVSVDETNEILAMSDSDVDNTVISNESNNVLAVENQDDDVGATEENGLCATAGTFADLSNDIANTGDELNLTRNYLFNSTIDYLYKNGIPINKKITINGNGYTINGNNEARVFIGNFDGTILNNITFINCFSLGYGGAIQYNGKISLTNCNFINCFSSGYAGTIYLNNDNSSVTNCNFINCSSSSAGGAILSYGENNYLGSNNFINCTSGVNSGAIYSIGNNCTLFNSSFINCSSGSGGAMKWISDNSNIFDCRFINCSASDYYEGDGGTGSMNGGGAIYLMSAKSLFNCTFIDCKASNALGGAILAFSSVFDCIFVNCSSKYGGGVCFRGEQLVNSTFINNTVTGKGSGVYMAKGKMITCTFINNNYYWYGGQVIKRDVNLSCDYSSFNYTNPNAITIMLTNLQCNLPITGSINFYFVRDINRSNITNCSCINCNCSDCNCSNDTEMNFTDYYYFNVPINNGNAYLCDELNNLSIGSWNVTVWYGGDANYDYASTTFNIKVKSSMDTELVIGSTNRYYFGEGILIKVLSNNSVVDEGFVTLYDNDKFVGTYHISGYMKYVPNNIGNHKITAYYDGGEFYKNSKNSANITIYKSNSDVNVFILDLSGNNTILMNSTMGFNITLVANVKGLYNVVNEGNVAFYFDDKFIGEVPVINGSASLPYIPLIAKNYIVKAVFKDSANFLDDEDSTNYTVNKADSTIKIDNANGTVDHNIKLVAYVNSSNNQTINEGIIIFFDGEINIGEINVINGIATLNYSPSTDGEHVITAIFNSDNYLDSNGTAKLLIDSVNVKVFVDQGVVGYNSTFVANVKGLYSIINEGTVSFYINNQFVDKVDVTNGFASLVYVPLVADDYNVKVVYGDSDNFLDDENSTTYIVNKADSTIHIVNANGTVGHNVTLTVIVNSSNNLTINEGVVTFFDGKTAIGKSNLKNGVGVLNYIPSINGEHTITAIYNSSNYLSSNDTAKLFVDSANINVFVDVGTVGFNSKFIANVKGLYSTINEGAVSLYIDNQYIEKLSVINGSVNFTYVPLIAGSHNVKVIYGDSDNFLNAENTTNFTVNKADSEIKISNVEGTVGHNVTLTVTVTSSNNIVINDGIVVFYDGKINIGEVNVIDGVATLYYIPSTDGEHSINAIFNSSNYIISNNTAKLLVDSATIEISVNTGIVGFESSFTAEVKGLYSIINEGTVSFYVNKDFVEKVSVVNGVATLSYVPLMAGNSVVKAIYGDSEKFLDIVSSSNYIVNQANSQVNINNLNGSYGDKLILTANVTSPNKLTINEGTLTFSDNGNLIGVATVINGVAKLDYIPNNAGNHVISAVYLGNNYISSNNALTISIDKVNTELILNNVVNAFYGIPCTISANIQSNNKTVQEGIVKFYINNQEIKSVSVETGYASFDYIPLNAGLFNVTAIFGESDNYASSQISQVFTANKLATTIAANDLDINYNDNNYFIATLKDIKGKPLIGVQVSVGLNGIKYLTTDNNGQVKLSTNGLAPKTYAATIIFAGDTDHTESTATVKVTVTKATPKLTAKAKTFKKALKTKKYTITLKDNQNNAMKNAKVTIKINKKTYTAKINAKGKATFKIKKLTKKGKYVATVTFKGNAYYNKVIKKVKIVVK